MISTTFGCINKYNGFWEKKCTISRRREKWTWSDCGTGRRQLEILSTCYARVPMIRLEVGWAHPSINVCFRMASSNRYNFSEYVDIFSDACMKAYPNNKISSFCNDLIEPQLLPEGAMVCLSEIEFVYALYNISSVAQTVQNSLTVFDFSPFCF